MKYIKILNILIIVMMLTTVLIPAVEASANYEITVVGKEFIVTGYLDFFDPPLVRRSHVSICVNEIRIYSQIHSVIGPPPFQVTTTITYTGIIETIHAFVGPFNRPRCRHPLPPGLYVYSPQMVYANIYRDGVFLEREHFTPPIPINLSHALNFTLAGAMALPTMTIDIVDDIMLTIGKYIKCGITKFAIRAALLKFAAKGVAITIAITGISYLLVEFADDIYNAIFISVPEINPGDTHFHETEIPQVMNVIDTYYPLLPHIRNAVEQSIRLHIDAQGLISIADVMQIIRNHQKNTVIDIYKETPEILPENININRYQVPEIMDMIDIYFPVELPIRNIIEQEIYRRIDNDEFNEIPFSEIINIIEQEQHIFIPEIPTQTPQEHQQYIDDIINKIIHEAPYIPTIEAVPFIFQGIPATPIIPRTPTRPNEKIHTFPFYSLFVDPLAAVIGITLAHLFAAMMIIGAIISIGATWGTIGAIFAGFIGTITTAYFGLTSWLIPVFLIVLLIIYANIRIKGGVGKE